MRVGTRGGVRLRACTLALTALVACSDDVTRTQRILDPDATARSVTEAAAALVAEGRAPGVVVMAAQRGEPLLTVAEAYADAEAGAPMRRDSIVHLASLTKPVTAVALLILYEEGAWTLDDPVEKFVPEFAGRMVMDKAGVLRPAQETLTMRHLLSHASGMPYHGDGPAGRLYAESNLAASGSTTGEMIARAAALPLTHEPGADFSYGFASDIQGAIVERLSGMGLGDFMRARIFDPLRMDDAGFHMPEDKRARMARVHRPGPQGPVPAPEFDPPLAPPTFASGGAGLYATVGDYLRFAQMLANGGELDGARLLQPETVALMRTNALDPSVNGHGHITRGSRDGFGLGVAVIERPRRDDPRGTGTVYWDGATGAFFWIDPVSDIVVAGVVPRAPDWADDGPAPQVVIRDALYGARE